MVKGAKGLSDSRFAHLKSDPKFGGLKRKERKVVVESRFAGVLTDPRFTRAPAVDKRGRKVKRSGDVTLHRLYEFDETEGGKKKETEESNKGEKEEESEVDSEEEIEEDSDEEGQVKYDLARGDGAFVSSSSEEEEDDEEWELEKEEVDHDWATLDKDARRVEWASRRLAICNLDWDSLSSEDLFFLVSSFKPLGGKVESLTIYMSDMGKEKLAREEREGPELKVDENDGEESDDEGRLDEETLKYNNKRREAIRKYQLERLKYFYALLVCDSEQTASAIYEHCDGVEYENSGLRLDLRFVPDQMTFDEDRVRERITEDDVDSKKYKPRELSNVAAATTKVKLTWEDSDVNREKKMRGAFDEDADLEAVSRDLIAPSSGEEEAEDDSDKEGKIERGNKERLALLLGGTDDDEEELEIEWEKEEEKEIEKERKTKNKSKNAWEEYLEKRKAKRKERKTAAKEERRKAKEERQNEIRPEKNRVVKEEKEEKDVAIDPRFSALFTDSAYSIDAASNLSKSKGLVEKQNAARRKRKAENETDGKAHGGQHSLIDKLKKRSAKWSS